VPFIATGRQGGLAGAHGFPVLQEDAHFIQCEAEREDVRCGIPIVVDQQLRSHVPDKRIEESRMKEKCQMKY
jgi:hypothetical protein